MATVAANRFSVKRDGSVFKRLGSSCGSRNNNTNIAAAAARRRNKVKEVFNNWLASASSPSCEDQQNNIPVVCKYWLQGRCLKNPCRFLHPDTNKSNHTWKNPNTPPVIVEKQKVIKNHHHHQQLIAALKQEEVLNVIQPKTTSVDNKTCTKQVNSITGQSKQVMVNCTNGQSWFSATGLSILAHLQGHTKGVTGILLPSGFDKLFCASKDKSLTVWDCNSGKCDNVLHFDDECGTLFTEDSWMFLGLRDKIKLETQTEVIIRGNGNGGQVNAIALSLDGALFAGMEDGTILSWKSTSETSFCEQPTSLKGHTGSVLSLVVGAGMLFSGSSDHSIRVWSPDSLECRHVLNGHTGDVTAVICWDQYLFTGSLDKTIKVWGEAENDNIEQVYKHDVDNGVLAFYGMHDAEEKPILLCSCKDTAVHLYDLPSFVERGRIFSRHDIQAIQVAQGLFFTGDAAGVVSVWKPNVEPVSRSC